MRRPLDWIVVSISLLVLFANRMLSHSDPVPVAAVPPTAESPFAYIREDGSEVFLPAVGPRLAGQAPNSTSNALYTWSLPMVTPSKEGLSFQ